MTVERNSSSQTQRESKQTNVDHLLDKTIGLQYVKPCISAVHSVIDVHTTVLEVAKVSKMRENELPVYNVPTSSSSAKSPIASKGPGILIATLIPESRMRRNSKSDAASSSQVRLQDAHRGGQWTQPRGNLSLQKRNQGMWTFPSLKLGVLKKKHS